jgi:transcriptional regulator with XRE-family HTH domain
MADRRTLSSSLSADVIRYLCEQGHPQTRIARMLGVTDGYISLVKSRDRSLTLNHLERLTESVSVPLGAFLLAVTKTDESKLTPQQKKLTALAAEIMHTADEARAAIMRSRPSARQAG